MNTNILITMCVLITLSKQLVHAFLLVFPLTQPNIVINLPQESTVTGTINSDRVDSPHLATNNPVKNGTAVDGATYDTYQREEGKKASWFTGTSKDIPHTYIIVPDTLETM